MQKLDNSTELGFKNNKVADKSAEDTDVKFIKKIQPAQSGENKTKTPVRTPRMGGCIPVSG